MALFKPVRWVVHHSESFGGGRLFIEKVAHENQGIDFCPYHFIISNGVDWGGFHEEELSDGLVIVGRADTLAGQHVHLHNSDSLGVCLIGNFDKAGKHPSQAQLNALIKLFIMGHAKYGITPIFANPGMTLAAATVWNHKDMPDNSTACPGDNMCDMTRRMSVIAYEAILSQRRPTKTPSPSKAGGHADTDT